jgi:FMN phosphatase YigB (HAD superfamily)
VPDDVPTRLLITDVDNTLYDWVDYFAPAFRSMVHLLSRELGVPEAVLVGQFRSLYEEMGTSEYPFAVQRLPALRGASPDEVTRLASWSRTAFSRSRIRSLRPYEGVRETLEWLVNQGVAVAAVTSSPSHVVISKLRALGLSGSISLVIAWEGFQVPDDETALALLGERTRQPNFATVLTLSRGELKPAEAPYRLAMRYTHAQPRETAIIGDSLFSDVEPALRTGSRALWARYGHSFSEKNRRTIEDITPGGRSAVSRAYSDGPTPEGVTEVWRFADLVDLLPRIQPTLF